MPVLLVLLDFVFRICVFVPSFSVSGRLDESAPKVSSGVIYLLAGLPTTKVWLGSFLSAYLVRFPYCVFSLFAAFLRDSAGHIVIVC